MATPLGMAITTRHGASGYALHVLPRDEDLHHLVGRQLSDPLLQPPASLCNAEVYTLARHLEKPPN